MPPLHRPSFLLASGHGPALLAGLLLAACSHVPLPPDPASPRVPQPQPGSESPAAPGRPLQYGLVRSIEQIEARDGAVRRYEVLVRLEQGGAERWFELGNLEGMKVGERVVIERGRLRRW